MSEQAPEIPAAPAESQVVHEAVHVRLHRLEEKVDQLLAKAETAEQAIAPVLADPNKLLARLFRPRPGAGAGG